MQNEIQESRKCMRGMQNFKAVSLKWIDFIILQPYKRYLPWQSLLEKEDEWS